MARHGGAESCKQSGEDLILVLVARDRSGATADCLLEAVSKDSLSQAVKPCLQADAILRTDGSATMPATVLQVRHEPLSLRAGKQVHGPWRI